MRLLVHALVHAPHHSPSPLTPHPSRLTLHPSPLAPRPAPLIPRPALLTLHPARTPSPGPPKGGACTKRVLGGAAPRAPGEALAANRPPPYQVRRTQRSSPHPTPMWGRLRTCICTRRHRCRRVRRRAPHPRPNGRVALLRDGRHAHSAPWHSGRSIAHTLSARARRRRCARAARWHAAAGAQGVGGRW